MTRMLLICLSLLLSAPALASEPISLGVAPASGPWTYGACTRVDDDTFSVVDNAGNVANFRPGVPLRYSDDATTWRYGITTVVTDVGATLTVDLTGAAMTAAFDAYCQWGQDYLVEEIVITDPGWWSDGADATLLLNDLLLIWPPSSTTTRYLVKFCAASIAVDTGANKADVYPLVNAVAASTSLTMTVAATWYCSTTATIDAAQYDLLNGETLELGTAAAGSNDDSSNLTAVYTLVSQGR